MNTITFDEFQEVDIRIGTIIQAEVPVWSHWVIKLVVDFGDPPAGAGIRTIFAGMMKFYKPEKLLNRQFPFVINIEPKKIGPEGDISYGMMLAADLIKDPTKPEEGKPVLFKLSQQVPNGTKAR